MITKITPLGSEVLPHQWEFSLQDSGKGKLERPPFLAGDRLVCFTETDVFALDVYTGEEVRVEGGFPRPIISDDPALPAQRRGTFYYIEDGKLIAVQLSDGKPPTKPDDTKRWKPQPVENPSSINAYDTVVALCEGDLSTQVRGFDVRNGEQLWGPVKVGQKTPGPVTTTTDALLFVSGGHLYAVNIRSGDTRFDFSPAVADPLAHDQPPQTGAIGDQTICVTTGKSAYGVDVSTGKQVWMKSATHPTANTQWFTPAISERFNLVVLANNEGEVFVLELTTGTPRWSAQLPNIGQVSIAGDKVYVETQSSTQFTVFELVSDKEKQVCVVKLDDVGHVDVVAGHGTLFTAGTEFIRAIPFSNQNAALFTTAKQSSITVVPKGSHLDFGEGDFTVETWVATTCGGELVSGFPTLADEKYHGFRVNVTRAGRIRFSVINRTAASSFAAVSPATNVADGYWHHVAVVRHNDAVEMYLDGVSLNVDSARKGAAALNIGGNNVLTFGAFRPGTTAQAHLNGLMRELRIWDIALDSSKLQSRMACTLTGKEPHMLGYWRMDEADIKQIINHVLHFQYTANVENVLSRATELALDKSAFPYLLDQVTLQWPYAGHWSAHGEEAVTTAPALDRSGILSFGAGNALYGVNASDGKRMWGIETPAGVSAPVATNGTFYALSGARGLIVIDAHTGAIDDAKGFDGLLLSRPDPGTRLSRPALDDHFTAAATPKGEVWVVERAKPDPSGKLVPWKWNTHDGAPGDLTIAGGRVYLIAGNTLYQLDPVAKKAQSFPVANKQFHAQDDLVFCVPAAGKVVALSASEFPKQKAAFNVPNGANVTGLSAASDADLLTVATDKGMLYGLTYATLATRWARGIPAGKADPSNALNVPTISTRTVFCTALSGAAAAVDARTGELQGLFFEPTKIITPPLADAGSVYFGCAQAPADADLEDGALHSVVFGQTHVLRLGLDRNGEREAAHGYATVTSGDVLELLGVDSCCVETWINTREGGEVLSICPNGKSATSKYGLRLWLDKDGTIHFTCVDEPADTGGHWQRITASAASPACNGRWHHLAVSRKSRKELTIYLDGIPVNTSPKVEDVAAPQLVDGLKAFIGADGTAAAPTNFFTGMIGEIRVWDTYLTATRLAERMHNKLIGNEPELLAYWNFDVLSIHDGARNGHDGKLETGGGSSGFWLADLNFTHPSYPYLETEGRIIQEGEEGGTGPLANTIYDLTVTARKADGGFLDAHDITLWYVRHEGEAGAATITVKTPKEVKDIQPVGPVHGDEQSVVGTTGNNGRVTFRITTKQYGHGPAIDLRPAFLPANERYHVSVLVDSQKLEKPAPPHLEAQASLIEDYHYQNGDHWDPKDEGAHAKRNRSTWRAVIIARNADGTARVGENLQLWAHEHVEVEVNGKTYPINPNNYQSFEADVKGELTVVLSADDLDVPALSAWAGFMHRDERFTIPLDQGANGKLAEVSGDKLATPQRTSWKPGYDPTKDNKPVVKEGYAPHAEKVATAIRHVMSVSQEPKPKTLIKPHAQRLAELMAQRNFSDMRQFTPVPRGDGVRTLRTLKHINRRAPADGETFLQSLDKLPDFKGSIGFMFTNDGKVPKVEPLKSLEHVKREFPRAFAPAPEVQPDPLGNIFEDAWDAIEDAAEAAWEAAKKVAVYIADQVTLVVDFAEKTVTKVVESVKEAIEAVVQIIKMIEALIEDVIRILMLLFDWSGIIETHNILKTVSQNQLKLVKEMVSAGRKSAFQNLLMGAFKAGTGPIDVSSHEAAHVSAASSREQHNKAGVQEQVNSVHGKYVDSKVDEHREQMVVHGKPSVDPPPTPVDQGSEARVLKLSDSLGGVLGNPLGAEFGELYELIKDLVSGDISKLGTELSNLMLDHFNVFADCVTSLEVVLTADFEIPFLSQLYKWITGSTLTLLDVTCLALAIPTHVGYGIFTAIAGKGVHRFPDDAKNLIKMQVSLGDQWGLSLADVGTNGHGDHAELTSHEHDLALHWCYFGLNILYVFGAATLKGYQVRRPIGWRLEKEMIKGCTIFLAEGLVAKSLLFTAGQKEGGWNELETAWNSTVFAVLVGLDLYTQYDLWLGVETGLETDTTRLVQLIKIIASCIGAALLVIRLDIWINHRSDVGKIFQLRGLIEAMALMLTFDDTKAFTKRADPLTIEHVLIAETVLKLVIGGVHIAAIIDDLPPAPLPAAEQFA